MSQESVGEALRILNGERVVNHQYNGLDFGYFD